MRWMRSFVPAGLCLVGIASTAAVGIAVAAQDQKEAQPTPAKTSVTENQDTSPPVANQANPATERPQSGVNRPLKATLEGQRSAALGAQFEAKGDMGLSVTTVEPNGALGQAGLRRNDRIISADGRAFNNPRQLEAYLWGQSGRAVPLIVERGGERHTIQANIPLHSANSGWLGIFLDEGDAKVQGALVAQVYPSGPAARAGIQVGDVIKQINSKEVIASHDAVMMLREFPPKAEITLTIQRDDEDLMLPVTVGSRTHFANHPSQVAPQHLPQSALQQPGQQANSTEAGSDPTHPFQGVPPYAMQLENDRRMAEQHERIEEELKLLRAEIQKLRELIEKK